MKKLLLLSTLFVFIPNKQTIPPNYYGVLGFEQHSVQIGESYVVGAPFYAATTTTIEYYYSIHNAQNTLTFTSITKSQQIRAGFTMYVRHDGNAQEISLGRNFMRIYFKYTGQNWRVFYLYFNAHDASSPIIINNSSNGNALLRNEVVYAYETGVASVVNTQTNFTTTPYSNIYQLPTDLFFNLAPLTTTFYNYGRVLLYEEAVLSFENDEIFPYMPTINGQKSIRLKLLLNDMSLSFQPYHNLYVDPATRYISQTQKPGFVVTNTIFFPRDKFDIVKNAVGQIKITGFSYSKFTLVYNFRLNVLSEYIGDRGLYQIEIERY